MLLKKSTPIMKCALVLFALLDLAYLVYANQGEPGPSAEEPGSPTSSLLQLSVMPSLFPDVSATSRMIANHPKSTETKLTTVSPFSGTSSSTHAQTSDVMKSEAHTTSLVQKRSLAASATPNLMQSQAGTASLVQSSISTDGHTEIPSAAQSPAKQSDVATGIVHSSISTTSDTRYSSVMQSPDMKETQAGSTNIMHASTAGGTRSAIQTHHLVQSKALTTDHAFASVPESAKSLNVPPTGTVVTIVSHLISKLTRDIMQSQAHSTTVAHASIFESVATRLPSSLAVPPPSTVLAQQNTSHRSISTQLHVPLSTQVPVITSEMKNNSSTMLFSASQSLDVVAMTTKGAPSSITPVKSLPSTSDVVARVTSSLGITPSGLASYGPSQLLTAVHTSWLQSSSVMLPPPTMLPPGTPDPPIIQDTLVLSATSVLLKWNATSANFSVELSLDSVSWKQTKCNQSLVHEACIVTQTEATITSLKPYTNYTFRVVAQNLLGRSNYSSESKWVVTNEAAPSHGPIITAAYNLSSQEIFISWQSLPPETLNGKLRRYELHITEKNTLPTSLPTSKSSDVVTYSASSVTSSLSPMFSTPVPTTPSNGGVTEPPTEENGRRKRQIGSPVVIDVGVALSHRVGGLKKWTSYEVEVRAVTVAPGPFSDKVTVRTDEDVPTHPTELTAKAVNSTAIFVNWTKPAEMNGVLVKYQVIYSEEDSSKLTVTRDVGKAESVMLTSLNSFTFYVIDVSAFTSKGGGNHSTVLERTDEGQPSLPQNFSTQSVNSTAILVSWQQPAKPNGKIKYRLSLSTGSEQMASFKLVYDGESTQYLVSNLKPYTRYNFKVTAYNVKYNLSSSSVVAMETTAQAAPSGPPQNVRAITNSSSSIILYWMPPKAAERNGEITRYNIHISSSALEHAGQLNAMANTTTLAITGLQAYTNYSFLVQAVNGAGIGPYSSTVTNKTFEAEPSPARNITAKSVNSTAIKVAWVKALHPNGIIRYQLYMRLRKDDKLKNRLVYEGINTGFVMSGLEEYVTYTFTVVSFNIKYTWTSKPVVVMETTHPAEPSGPPQDVQALTVSSTAIEVKWSPPLPSERNGIIILYTVQYTSQLGESNNTTAIGTSIVVNGLAIFMKYSFTVKAWNLVGAGPESEAVSNSTLEDRPSPPTNIGMQTMNSSAIKVTWQAPLKPNGEIQYRLYYWQSSEGSGTRKLAYDGSLVEYTVAGLHEYVTYMFMLQAYNVKYSWSSTAVNASETTHPAEPSGPPHDVVALTKSSTSILVKWSPPSELDRNGIITHYIVQYNVSLETEANISTSDNSTHTLVAPLRKYAPYYFTVRAVNTIGVGPPSAAVINVTFEDLPGQPVIESVNEKSDSLEVMWKPPIEANGIIKTFRLCWRLVEVQNRTCIVLNGATRSYEIPYLRSFSQYTVSLTASTSVGLGQNYTNIYTTTEGVPSKPQDLRAWNMTGYSIVVTWKKPLNVNGRLQGYTVFYRPTSSTDQPLSKNVGLHTNTTLSQLTPYTFYDVTVQAVTGAGGGATSLVQILTDETVPSKPQDLRALNITGYSIVVTWKKPLNVNGRLQRYTVFYRPTSSTDQPLSKNVGLHTNTTLSQLTPYTFYDVTVQAVTGAGGGATSLVQILTDETEPSAVVSLMIHTERITSHSMELSWQPPSKPNGNIGYYLYYWKTSGDASAGKSIILAGNTRNKLVGGLKAYTHYTFSVVAYNLKKNLSGPRRLEYGMTKATVPSGPPRNVVINETTSTSLTLSWDPPLEPNGEIVGYDVKYYEPDKPGKKTINDNVNGRIYTIKDLEPWRDYRIHVACQSTGGIGPFSDFVEKRTDPGAPPPLGTLAPPDKETIQSFSFRVELAEASNEKGVVSFYQVIVIELATDNTDKAVPAQDPDSYKAEDLKTYDEARRKKPQLVPYIAAEFSAKDFDDFKFFVVGDGKQTSAVTNDVVSKRKRRESATRSGFYNGPLEEDTFYAVFQRAYVNKDVYTSSPWIDPVETAAAFRPSPKTPVTTSIGLIVGLVLVIVIVCILILVGIYFVRRKRTNFDKVLDDREDYSNGQPVRMKKLSRKRRSLQKRLMGSTESLDGLEELAASRARRLPVPIDDFERHVDRMHMDGDHGFSEEYALVQPDDEFSFQQFLNPANKYKNRYANIVAYDHTRVMLNPIEGVAGSDYMNANFIDGYNRQRAYIAAQGPLMETFDDFWRMMWEQMSSVIVMLTKLEERGRRKCDQYWPERGMKNYGPIQVTLKQTLNMSHYTVRKLVMTHKQFPDDDRAVKQFHFTAWPDHGVPSHPTPLLSLVRHTFSANRESVGPMVVHCSAGVGRTGTFITLDVMLQRISQEDSVDVFGFVRQMRYQRNFMVQTEAQYVFIHDALHEAITCGVTEVEAKDLGCRIRELRQFDPETGYTYLENEFCRLAKEENHPIAFKSASLNCNAAKNRYANILPFESTRVHLKMRPGEMGSDYVNASFIDGYCQPRAYIATQAPVPDTFEDIWRLVWEQESATIVMLTREEEAGKVKCHHYWPSEGSRLYGVILVEQTEESSFGDYISRKFKLTHTEAKESRTVTQFQYTDWPDTGLPDSGVGIVDLIGQVQKWQQQSGNTIIVIHCSGGVGRTGVFCGISMMIERLKAEGLIDVFQTVQAMRLQRPAMVQTAEQYEFCYTTLQEYLDSFDLYANFQ